ncbi:MAG TPA: histidine kinase [Roseiflexaceae bacterium]|nr:histidine kinase [Roseiflexaceae bacterium]
MEPAISASGSGRKRPGEANSWFALSRTLAGRRLDTAAKGPRALPGVARLIVCLLGLFFLAYPILAVLRSGPAPAQACLAVGGGALFGGVFLRLLWLHEPLQLVPAQPSEILKYRAAIVFLAVLAGALNLAQGTVWGMLFLYHINIAASIMLVRRDAYLAILGIAAIICVLAAPVGMVWVVVPAASLGLWATAFVGQVSAVAELRAAREELARLAVAEERLRFARDLHDLLGHSLSLITLKNELAGKLLPASPERAAKEIREAEAVARRALREVREAVAGYRQPTLLEELHGAEEMLAAAGMACQIENSAGLLPKSTEAVLAWAVREGTTNVIRHSCARRCTIRLLRDELTVGLEVCDDGRGCVARRESTDKLDRGSGLAGLAERVAGFAGAAFEAGPLPEGGFGLSVRLPIANGDGKGQR